MTVQSSAKEEPIFKTFRAQIAKLNVQIISDRLQGSAQPVDIILLSDPLPVIIDRSCGLAATKTLRHVVSDTLLWK